MPELEYHPIAESFPSLSPEDLRALAKDIATNGLREPIVMFEGKILDGRHRYQACLTENIPPHFVEYGGSDPVAFVESMNFYRRHLTRDEKRARVKALLKRNPSLSDRAVGREVGVDHTTVAQVRREEDQHETEAMANGETPHKESDEGIAHLAGRAQQEDGVALSTRSSPSEGIDAGSPAADRGSGFSESKGLQRAGAPATPLAERVESTGRKARGRKPGSTAAAKAPKKVKPRPLTNARDEWISSTSQRLNADTFHAVEDLVHIVSGYDGVIQVELTMSQRRELVRKFAKALGVKLADILDI